MKNIVKLLVIFIGFSGLFNAYAMNMVEDASFNRGDLMSLKDEYKNDPEIKSLVKSMLQDDKDIKKINKSLLEIRKLEKGNNLNNLFRATDVANRAIVAVEKRTPKHNSVLPLKKEKYYPTSRAGEEFEQLPRRATKKYPKQQPIPANKALNIMLKSNNPELGAANFARFYSIKDIDAKISLKSCPGAQTLLHIYLTDPTIDHKTIIKAIKILLIWGIDINTIDSFGNTALHYAALTGNREAIQLLGQAGANANIRNEKGNTPLLELYYEKAGIINDRKKSNELLLDLYVENKWLHGTNKECIKKLLLLGSDITIKNNAGEAIITYLEPKNDDSWFSYLSSYYSQPTKSDTSEMANLVKTYHRPVEKTQLVQRRARLFENSGLYTPGQVALFAKELDFLEKQ